MRQILGRMKLIFAAFAFVLTTAMSSGGAVLAYSMDNPSGDYHKVYVCKYVGKPGVDERLQTGDNPISVSTNSLKNFTGLGSYFNDKQERSVAIAWDNGDKIEPLVSMCPSPNQTTPVTPLEPSKSTPSCESPNMTVTPAMISGVLWSPAGTTVLQPGESVTYTASADTANGYVLEAGAKTSWTFKNEFDPSDCNNNCGCNDTVTPGDVKFKDVCGIDSDAYYIPKTSHVKYYVNGSNTAATSGWHDLKGLGAITVVAKADQGYKLSGQSEWTGTFTDLPCKVRPKPVEFIDRCGTENDKFIIPSKKNVEYRVDGDQAAAGEYEGTGTVVVTAVPLNGFQLKGQTTWTKTFTDEPCGGHGGDGVMPGEVTFTDITCESKGSFTIPNTPGVVYKDANGTVLAAGTHQVTTAMSLDVTAFPENDSDTLSGQTTWSHKFKLPVNCETGGGETTAPPETTGGGQGGGFVLGESTTLPGGGKGAGEVLANTGAHTLVTTLLSLMMVGGSLALYAYRPKVEQQ